MIEKFIFLHQLFWKNIFLIRSLEITEKFIRGLIVKLNNEGLGYFQFGFIVITTFVLLQF